MKYDLRNFKRIPNHKYLPQLAFLVNNQILQISWLKTTPIYNLSFCQSKSGHSIAGSPAQGHDKAEIKGCILIWSSGSLGSLEFLAEFSSFEL